MTGVNTNPDRYKQLADAVQLYLNGDYSKILQDDSSPKNQNDDEDEDENEENNEDAVAAVMSKIEENQRKQIEQIYIVDNINEVEEMQQSPIRNVHHERRVTTVEEQ